MIYTMEHQSDCQSNNKSFPLPQQLQQQPTGTLVLTLPADGSRPQLLTLTNTFNPATEESPFINTTAASTLDTTCTTSSSALATTPISSTIMDLTNMINTSQASSITDLGIIHQEPLDLSTPTMRENLTFASSLALSEAEVDITNTASDAMFTTAETCKVVMRPSTTSVAANSNVSPTVIDPELAYAALTAVTSGSITPLVKEELKCTIQQKRLSEGKGELKVKFDDPRPSKLSEEEKEKRGRRRERNRVAAQKCRTKRREKADVLQEESVELESRNQMLRDEIAKLEEEKERLRHMMLTHDILPTKCNMKLSTSEDDDCSISTYTRDDNMKDDDLMCQIMEDSDEDDDDDDDGFLDQVL